MAVNLTALALGLRPRVSGLFTAILFSATCNRPVAVGVVNDVIVSEPPYWWTAEYGVYGELV